MFDDPDRLGCKRDSFSSFIEVDRHEVLLESPHQLAAVRFAKLAGEIAWREVARDDSVSVLFGATVEQLEQHALSARRLPLSREIIED